MEYTEVDIKIREVDPFTEIIIAKLNLIDYETFYENDNGVKCYIQSQNFNKEKLLEVLDEVSTKVKLEYSFNEIPQKNWNEEWEKNFDPIEINSKCFVRSKFHQINDAYDNEIIITPKMSFGTGHHETTFLMLNEMYNLNFKEKLILDVGCGTGILSILSSQKGAKEVVGIDTDEWAYQNSLENSDLNGIDNINFFKGDINIVLDSKFNIILANINTNVILDEISKYYDLLLKNGDLLISGFLKEDLSIISKVANEVGFKLINKKNKDKWFMMHLSK
tara:strand:- start:4797 stop:5627 length:831 start_codon:yes stop_codon:yes gene_type:complete